MAYPAAFDTDVGLTTPQLVALAHEDDMEDMSVVWTSIKEYLIHARVVVSPRDDKPITDGNAAKGIQEQGTGGTPYESKMCIYQRTRQDGCC